MPAKPTERNRRHHHTAGLRALPVALLTAASLLAACVGGGGSPGDTLEVQDTREDSSEADVGSDGDTTQPAPDTDDTASDLDDTRDALPNDDTASDTAAPDSDVADAQDQADEDVAVCAAGHEDCDGDAANGCESLSSLEHCGSCNNDCTERFADAQASCAEGSCWLADCNEGFGDCDGVQDNGCEVDWGPVGGRCCAGGGVVLDVTGASVRRADQGVWAIYKNGGALAEDLRCGQEWDTPQVAAALDPSQYPVDLVWRRNCPESLNDDLRSWFESGQLKDVAFVVSDDAGGEVWRAAVQVEIVSYVHLPLGDVCTELEQITFRIH